MNKNQEGEVRIELSKMKILLLVAGSLLFAAIGAFLVRGDTVAQAVGIISILFFGSTGLFGIYKLFDSRPGLIINDKGIQDYSSAVGSRFIAWDQIRDIDVDKVQSTRFLFIFVNDPEAIMKKEGPVKRAMMRLNNRFYGTPVSISSSSLKCDFDDLITAVAKRLKEHRTIDKDGVTKL